MLRCIAGIIVLFFFISCNNVKSECEINNEFIRSLESSSSFIRQLSQQSYKEFSYRLHDVRFAEDCEKWQKEVDSIKVLTDSLIDFISDVKDIIRQEMAGSGKTNSDATKDEKFKSAYKQLVIYGSNMLNLNDEISIVFKRRETNLLVHLDTTYSLFANKYFNKKPDCIQLSALCKIENDICRFEADLASFCNIKTMPITEHYYSFKAIIAQSSNIVKPGDAIDITAGIGSFSRAANPSITINNEVVKINESAVAVHKIKASQKPGLYSVPVTIEFYNQDGEKLKHKYAVEYTVKE